MKAFAPMGLVRIVAALVNSVESPEKEVVTLINTAPHPIALDGWTLLDTQKARVPLKGTLQAGATITVRRRWRSPTRAVRSAYSTTRG